MFIYTSNVLTTHNAFLVQNFVFLNSGPLIDFIAEFLGLRSEKDLAQSLRNPRKFDEASRELKGLKVRVQTPNNQVSIRNSYLRNFKVVICCVEPISVKKTDFKYWLC